MQPAAYWDAVDYPPLPPIWCVFSTGMGENVPANGFPHPSWAKSLFPDIFPPSLAISSALRIGHFGHSFLLPAKKMPGLSTSLSHIFVDPFWPLGRFPRPFFPSPPPPNFHGIAQTSFPLPLQWPFPPHPFCQQRGSQCHGPFFSPVLMAAPFQPASIRRRRSPLPFTAPTQENKWSGGKANLCACAVPSAGWRLEGVTTSTIGLPPQRNGQYGSGGGGVRRVPGLFFKKVAIKGLLFANNKQKNR